MSDISQEVLNFLILRNYNAGILPQLPKCESNAFVLIRAMKEVLPREAIEQWLIECVEEDPFITSRMPSMYFLACEFAGQKLSRWQRAKARVNYWLG